MIEQILYNLYSSRMLIITFFGIFLIVTPIAFIITNKSKLKNEKITLYGLLLDMDNKNIIIFSVIILRTFIMIFYALVCRKNEIIGLVIIGIISLIYIILHFKNIIYEIINTASVVLAIYFINLLNNYLIDIENSISVQIIKIVLVSFVIMYIVYITLKEIEEITYREMIKRGDGQNEEKES